MTGLRPIRSDSRPQSGLNTNCASEKLAMSHPIVALVAPKV